MSPVREVASVGTTHRSLSDQIFAELRELIVEGVLTPGQRLLERDLATQLTVSRIPLREAILQLEAEGLVQRAPRRGTVVATFTREDVSDLFDIRVPLESLAAGLAAKRATPASLEVLNEKLLQLIEATHARQESALARLNVEFHIEIVRASGSPLLVAMMSPLHGRLHWLFRKLLTGGMNPTKLCVEHQEIYQAIADGDHERAERLARDHIVETREPTMAQLARLDLG